MASDIFTAITRSSSLHHGHAFHHLSLGGWLGPSPSPNWAKGPVPSVPVSPKAQGGNRGDSHKTTLSSPPAPPRLAPSAVPRMWNLQHPPRWVHSWGRLTKKGGSQKPSLSQAPPTSRPAPHLHPAPLSAPRLRERPCSECAPPKRLLAWARVGLWGSQVRQLPGQRNPRSGHQAERAMTSQSLVGSRCLLAVQLLAGWVTAASGCDVHPPLPARWSPLQSSLPKPVSPARPSALVALQTHISEAVPVLDLAAVLRDGRQPLLVLHEIAGGLALFEPFGVAFSQGGRGEEQQRQCQRSAAWGVHPGLGSTWRVLTPAVF